MTQTGADVLQGTLDLLILKSLSLEPQHGWAISERIHQVSRETLQIPQGSLGRIDALTPDQLVPATAVCPRRLFVPGVPSLDQSSSSSVNHAPMNCLTCTGTRNASARQCWTACAERGR